MLLITILFILALIFIFLVLPVASNLLQGKPINAKSKYALIGIAFLFIVCGFAFQSSVNDGINGLIDQFFWLDPIETKIAVTVVFIISAIFFIPAVKLAFFKTSTLIRWTIIGAVVLFAAYEFTKHTRPISDQCIDKKTGENQCVMYSLPSGEVKIQLKGDRASPTWANLGTPTPDDMLAYDPNLVAPKANRIYITSAQECESYSFFDSYARPQVFYAITDKGYELFDKPIKHPRTRAATKPLDTNTVADLCRVVASQEQADKARKIKEQAEKIKAENARIRKEMALKAAEERRIQAAIIAEKNKILVAQASEEKRIRDEKQAESDRAEADAKAAENDQMEQQAANTRQIEQSYQGAPSEYCLGLFRNEGLTITVVNNRCGDFNNPNCTSVSTMLKTNGMSVVDYAASTQVKTLPGCVAYQGTDRESNHEQTLRCLVKTLGPGYFVGQSCSTFRYGGNGYEVNRI
ncbi:hypothetical protein [Methyloglobulus sp.]|uniref:hypothetical protein n=1 Tax=Methyloglobulus sp. TaxID=2518622 RepID=UPI003989B992